MSSARITTLLLAATGFACALFAHPARAAQATAAVEVPLAPYFGDLRTVPVMLGGDTLRFLLDSGGGLTVLTPATAAKAGLKPFGQFTGFRWNGEKLTGTRGGAVTLGIGGREFRCETGVGDLEALGVKGVAGIVCLQTFEGSALTIDLAANRLVLESPASLKRRASAARPLTVRASRQCGGSSLDLFVRALAPAGDLWLEMDCGNMGTAILAPHAYGQLGVEPAAGGTGPVTLELAGLGPVTLEARKAEGIYDGLLNSSFFMHHAVTFDLANIRAWAVANPPGR